MAPVTLPENEVQESEFRETETRSDLQELKITAQVMGYHALKSMLPAVMVIITLACGITLSLWALNQLNKLPIQAFPSFNSPEAATPVSGQKTKVLAPPLVHAAVHKKASKAKVVAKHQYKRPATRHSSYQDPWAEYYEYAPSHPRGGEIIHSDGMVTEYSWNKKR